MDAFILRLQDDYKRLCERVDEIEKNMPGMYHEHLLDPDEHAAHHVKMAEDAKPKENRQGERRAGERRVSTDKYEGAERRA